METKKLKVVELLGTIALVAVASAYLNSSKKEPKQAILSPSVDGLALGASSEIVRTKWGKPDFVYGPVWYYRRGITFNYVSIREHLVAEVNGNKLYDGPALLAESGMSKAEIHRRLSDYMVAESSEGEVELLAKTARVSILLSGDKVVGFSLQSNKVNAPELF